LTVYAESSAVLAWLLDQEGGKEAEAILRDARHVAASDLTFFECDRALRRGRDAGMLTAAQMRRAMDFLEASALRWQVLPLSAEVLAVARRDYPAEPVRSLDALHLGSVLYLRDTLRDLALLTLDARVASNARLLGVPVLPAPRPRSIR
jgi:uncharacterized protein with PIN domain